MENILIDGIEYFYDIDKDQLVQIPSNKCTLKEGLNYLRYKNDNVEQLVQSNQSNQLTESDLWYPEKPDIDLWESFLNRNLTYEEKELMLEVVVENDLNKQIKALKYNILDLNCFIPKLTNNNGNCLFESLACLGLGENNLGIEHDKIIRDNLSSVLLYVRNCSDFFPNVNISPEEIFNNSNDVEFIRFKKTNEVWEYNYFII